MEKNRIILDHDKVLLAIAETGKSMSELAKDAGVKRQYFTQLVNTYAFTPRAAGKLAKVLNTTVKDLI